MHQDVERDPKIKVVDREAIGAGLTRSGLGSAGAADLPANAASNDMMGRRWTVRRVINRCPEPGYNQRVIASGLGD